MVYSYFNHIYLFMVKLGMVYDYFNHINIVNPILLVIPAFPTRLSTKEVDHVPQPTQAPRVWHQHLPIFEHI